jgi:hypothetical protein
MDTCIQRTPWNRGGYRFRLNNGRHAVLRSAYGSLGGSRLPGAISTCKPGLGLETATQPKMQFLWATDTLGGHRILLKTAPSHLQVARAPFAIWMWSTVEARRDRDNSSGQGQVRAQGMAGWACLGHGPRDPPRELISRREPEDESNGTKLPLFASQSSTKAQAIGLGHHQKYATRPSDAFRLPRCCLTGSGSCLNAPLPPMALSLIPSPAAAVLAQNPSRRCRVRGAGCREPGINAPELDAIGYGR